MGRTQMQDAVPMTLGQTFGGFASILNDEIANLEFAAKVFLTVNMGATAIGTGICAVQDMLRNAWRLFPTLQALNSGCRAT